MTEIGWLALGAAIGTIIGFCINEILGRGVRAVDRRRARRAPLLLHVETDPSIIWVGAPPWIGAGFLVPPEVDISNPPDQCPNWRAWALALGGVDEGVTHVRVTLAAKENLVVVVDGVRVQVMSRQPVPPWRAITCAVGGADITPRHANIMLSGFAEPIVTWVNEAGGPVQPPTFHYREVKRR